jgi:5-deoxy-5-amino-3-dehydroquinate synthase
VLLNYGHTLAHALEAAGLASEDATSGPDQLRHGEAVGIGLVFAAELAHRMGRIDPPRVERHREVVAGYSLPVELPPGADLAQLVAFMERDKKSDGGLAFVLDGPAGVELVTGVSPGLVYETLEAFGDGR